jgi:hypothetical protein
MRWLVLANYVHRNYFPETAACTQRCYRMLRKRP